MIFVFVTIMGSMVVVFKGDIYFFSYHLFIN